MAEVNITYEGGSVVVEVDNPTDTGSIVLAYAQKVDVGLDVAEHTLRNHDLTFSNGNYVFHPKATYGRDVIK